jgi:hypothetical protein
MSTEGLRFPKRRIRLWLAVLLTLTAAVCPPHTQAQRDTLAILDLGACKLPCWIGIVPGETTIWDAVRLIHAHFDRKHYSIVKVEPFPGWAQRRNIVITSLTDSSSLYIQFRSDSYDQRVTPAIVREIYLSAYRDDRSATVTDLMPLLGRPECLAAAWGHHRAFPSMLYPEYSVQLTFGSEAFEVAPDMGVTLHLFDEPYLCREYFSIPWQGFNHSYHDEFIASMQP